MKLHDNKRNVVVSGEKSKKKFKISASAKAFKILSDGIYSDKIRSIIRELSTNAYDSHVEAGNQNKPFDLHLPTITESYFSIRDYGTGMSKEKIENLYTVYFESDRSESDDFTGALGLGSKSPFSYTDSFTVNSYYHGEIYTYTCYKDDEGEPQISLFFEGKTDEPNGFEVIIPVDNRSNDAYEFKTKASNVYYAFPVKPNLTGEKIKFMEPEVQYQGKDWRVVKRPSYRSSVYAIQANIAYPIDIESIPREYHNDQFINFLQRVDADIFFETGELDVSTSRESLGYDKQTIENIVKKVNNVIEELQWIVDKEASKYKNYWEVTVALDKFVNSAITRVVGYAHWQEYKINLKSDSCLNFEKSIWKIQYEKKGNDLRRWQNQSRNVSIPFGNKFLFVVNNEGSERKCTNKVRYFLKNNNEYDHVIIIDKSEWRNFYLRKFYWPKAKLSSSLPKPVYKKRKKADFHKNYLDMAKNRYGRPNYETANEVNLNQVHYYITIKNHKAVVGDNVIDIQKFIDFAKEFDLLGESKVYGVKPNEQRKKRFKESEWVEFISYVEKQFYARYKEFEELIKVDNTLNSNNTSYKADRLFDGDLFKYIENWSSKFFETKKVFDKIGEYRAKMREATLGNKVRVVKKMMYYFDIERPKPEFNFDKYYDKFLENYPLLKRWEYNGEKSLKEVAEYINAIDLYRG